MERCVKKVVQKRKKDLTGPTLLEMPVYPGALRFARDSATIAQNFASAEAAPELRSRLCYFALQKTAILRVFEQQLHRDLRGE
jgi:hypothetical protein